MTQAAKNTVTGLAPRRSVSTASKLNHPSTAHSLLPRIFLYTAVIGIVTGLLVAFVQFNLDVHSGQKKLHAAVQNTLDSIVLDAAEAIYNADENKTALIISGLSSLSGVDGAEMFGEDGAKIAGSAPVVVAEKRGWFAEYFYDDNILNEIALFVPNRVESVGFLRVFVNPYQVTDLLISNARSELLLTLTSILLLATTLSFVFYRLFCSPLVAAARELVENVDSGAADLTVTIPKSVEKSELGTLLKSYNSFASELEKKNREIEFQKIALDEHAIVSMSDAAGNITYINNKFLEITGYSEKEMLGQNHRLLKSDEHSPEFYDEMWSTISNGNVWAGEIKNFKKSGGCYWVKATIIPFLDDHGIPDHYISIRTDITEVKTKEAQIRLFKTTLDLTQDEVYMFWPKTLKFFYVNKAVCRKLGYPEKEILKLGPVEIKPDIDEDRFRELIAPLLDHTESIIEFQANHQHKDGSIVPVEISLQLIEQPGENPHFLAVVRDIGEKRASELQISQFEATLDNIVDPVYMFWPDSLKFFYVNQAAKNLSGHSLKQYLRMTPKNLNPNFNLEAFRARCKPLVFGTVNSITYETEHLNSEGELIPFEVLLQIIEPDGAKPRFVAITRNIRERREIEKAKSDFLSTVSHELRTPLTSIKGAVGLVAAGMTGKIPKKAVEILELANKNSDRLERIINDMLDVELAKAGNLDLQMAPMDLVALVNEAIDINKGIGEEYEVTFRGPITDSVAMVVGDKKRLLQVMTNLMSNAAKFSKIGAIVEIDISRTSDRFLVAVRDFGVGIPDAKKDRIFEEFGQVDSSDNRRRGGAGLGLSICKSIVESHGGSIHFESKVGVGTTFFFDLQESVIPST